MTGMVFMIALALLLPVCLSYYCDVGLWVSWGSCSRPCGGGVKYRLGSIYCSPGAMPQECLRDCHVESSDLQESIICNRYCYNGGDFSSIAGCECRPEYSGYCCQEFESNKTTSPCCSWNSWGPWGTCRSHDATTNGKKFRQREPICRKGEDRRDCMRRCYYTEGIGHTMDKKECYSRSSSEGTHTVICISVVVVCTLYALTDIMQV